MEILEAFLGALVLLVVIVLVATIISVSKQLQKQYRISRSARSHARRTQESEAFEDGIRITLLEEGFSASEVEAALREPESDSDGK